MDVLFSATYHTTKDRIRAKVTLWTTLADLYPDVLTYPDVNGEILRTAIYNLHPYYTGPEICEETKLLLLSLHLPVPHNHTALFADAFQKIVSAKIRQHYKSGL